MKFTPENLLRATNARGRVNGAKHANSGLILGNGIGERVIVLLFLVLNHETNLHKNIKDNKELTHS